MKVINFYSIIFSLFILYSCNSNKNNPIDNSIDKKLILTPHLHQDKVTFSYHGEVYIGFLSDNKVKNINRLDLGQGFKIYPRFSPNGDMIVYLNIGETDGDLFLFNLNNKKNERITYSPGIEYPLDWSQNSEKILFSKSNELITPYVSAIFEISAKGGIPVPLNIEGSAATYTTNNSLLFNRYPIYDWRPGYNGGKNNCIYKKYNDSKINKLLSSNNQSIIYPMEGKNGIIYFLSNKDSVWNLCSSKESGLFKSIKQITHFPQNVYYPSLSTDKKKIIFENDGNLMVYDTEKKDLAKVALDFPKQENQLFDVDSDLNLDWEEVVLAASGNEIFYLIDNLIYKGNISSNGVFIEHLSWANPNNKKIRSIGISQDDRYLSFIQSNISNDSIIVMDLSKGEKVWGTSDFIPEKCALKWSPWVNKLMWYSRVNGLLVFDLEQKKTFPIFKHKNDLTDYKWGIRSRQVIFSYESDDLSKIYLYDFNRFKKKIKNPKTKKDSIIIKSDSIAWKYLKSNYNEKDPVLTCCGKNDVFLVINQNEQPGSLIHCVFNDTSYKLEEIIPIFKERGNFHNLYSKLNKLFFINDISLKSFELDGKLVKDISDSVSNYEVSFGQKMIIQKMNGKLLLYDILSNAFTELNIVNPNISNKYSISENTRNLMKGIHRTCLENMYKNHTSASLEANLNYYLSFANEVTSKTEQDLLIFRYLGSFNKSHFYPDKREPFYRYGGTSLSNILGFDFIPGPKNRLLISKIFKSDPYGYSSLSPLQFKADKISIGDTLDIINTHKIFNIENIYKYIDHTGNWVGVKDHKNRLNEFAIIPDRIENLRYNDWKNRNSEFVDKESNGTVAYIPLLSFESRALTEWSTNFSKYKNYDKVIIDVRFNVGGVFDAYLIKEITTPIYGYTIDNLNNRKTRPESYINKKFVLLVNEYSVSASEVFAQAFKVLKIGKVIGSKTAGECLSPETFLIEGERFSIPVKYFVDIDKKMIENEGVQPDIVVNNPPDFLYHSCEYDKQLIKAIQLLK